MKKDLLILTAFLLFSFGLSAQISLSGSLVIEVRTHSVPNFMAWEITNADGGIVYEGGNTKVASFGTGALTYPLPNRDYNHTIDLPSDGTYTFRAYTNPVFQFCCAFGEGYVHLKDTDGNLLFEAREFTGSLSETIEVTGVNSVENAGFLRDLGEFPALTSCDPVKYKQTVDFANAGSNDITSAQFDLLLNDEVISTKNWTGTLAPGGPGFFIFDQVTIDEPGKLEVRLNSINGVDNTIDYVNSLDQTFEGFYKAATRDVTLTFKTDDKAHELYWEFIFTNNGNEIASGGNIRVGAGPGGTMTASTTDPGAYMNQEEVSVDLRVRAAGGCYVLRFKDDFGDGFFNIDGPITITDTAGVEIPMGLFFSASTEYYIDFDFSPPVGVNELAGVSDFKVFPNPVSDIINLEFNLETEADLEISLLNRLGQTEEILLPKQKMSGLIQVEKSVGDLESGMYLIRITDGEKSAFKKVMVLK